MRKPQGYATVYDPNGLHECDTFTCGHCNYITHVKAMADPAELGGMCYGCMRLICKRCVGKGCDPIEKKCERWEAEYEARRSYGLV